MKRNYWHSEINECSIAMITGTYMLKIWGSKNLIQHAAVVYCHDEENKRHQIRETTKFLRDWAVSNGFEIEDRTPRNRTFYLKDEEAAVAFALRFF